MNSTAVRLALRSMVLSGCPAVAAITLLHPAWALAAALTAIPVVSGSALVLFFARTAQRPVDRKVYELGQRQAWNEQELSAIRRAVREAFRHTDRDVPDAVDEHGLRRRRLRAVHPQVSDETGPQQAVLSRAALGAQPHRPHFPRQFDERFRVLRVEAFRRGDPGERPVVVDVFAGSVTAEDLVEDKRSVGPVLT